MKPQSVCPQLVKIQRSWKYINYLAFCLIKFKLVHVFHWRSSESGPNQNKKGKMFKFCRSRRWQPTTSFKHRHRNRHSRDLRQLQESSSTLTNFTSPSLWHSPLQEESSHQRDKALSRLLRWPSHRSNYPQGEKSDQIWQYLYGILLNLATLSSQFQGAACDFLTLTFLSGKRFRRHSLGLLYDGRSR